MPLQKFYRLTLAVTFCASLAACSGGSSSSSSSSSNSSTSTGGNNTGLSLTGSAAKGFLIGADVTLYSVTGGKRGNAIASTVTDENGDYSFANLQPFSGPALIEVRTRATSTMLDEVKGKIAAPADLVFRAAVPDIATVSEVHLTPFSEMAVSAAEASGQMSAATIETANKGVETEYLSGTPLLETRPLKAGDFAASGSNERRTLTKALTAIAAAALQGDATDENSVKCSDPDYAKRVKCAARGLAKGITLTANGTSATPTQGQVDVMTKGLGHLNKGEVDVINGEGKPEKANLDLGKDRLAFEARFGQTSGTNTEVTPPPSANTVEAINAARAMVDGITKLPSAAQIWKTDHENGALKTVQDPVYLNTAAASVSFMADLIQASRIAKGEIAANSLAKSRCKKTTNNTGRCTSTSAINENGYINTILDVTRVGNDFNWSSRSQGTNCKITNGTRICTTQPATAEFKGTLSSPEGTMTATGKISGLGDFVSRNVVLIIDLSKAYDAKRALTGPITIIGSSFEVVPNQVTPSDQAAATRFDFSFGKGSTFTLNPGGSPKLASLDLLTEKSQNYYQLKGKATISGFVVRTKNGEDDRIPTQLKFLGETLNNQMTGTQFVGLQNFEFPNAGGFDPTKAASASNFMKQTTNTSGTSAINSGPTLRVNETINRTKQDVRITKTTVVLPGSNINQQLTVDRVENPLNADFTFSFQNGGNTKITGGQRGDVTSGTVFSGASQIGTLNLKEAVIEFVDRSTLRLPSWLQ